ncbi:MAG: hypothetical protein IAE91_11840 [Ignavibacteriaceae bacterium]|nr:hypothetical protein [Ignavibacteriaceae bacterium]
MAAQNMQQSGPKTAFGKWMVYKFIPQYSNNVQGLVYVGAAVLIIIVGLRGLGTAAGEIAFIPSFMLDAKNAIDKNYVLGALLLEFFLLFILAVVTFFTPEEVHYGAEEEKGDAGSSTSHNIINVPKGLSADLKAELESLQKVTDAQMKAIEDYVEKYNALSKKITMIQQSQLNSLADLKNQLNK